MRRREALEWMLKGAAAAAAAFAIPKFASASPYQEIRDITTVVDDSNFAKEVGEHDGKAIVLFHSTGWEPESEKIYPLFKELVRDYGDKVKFCSYELDRSFDNWKTDPNALEKWKRLNREYGVTIIPTINMYIDGDYDSRVKGRPGEKITKEMITNFIAEWINNK